MIRRYLRRTTLIFLGVLFAVLLSYLTYPHWIVTLLRKQVPNVLYSVDTDQPVVALTIDDGPDTPSTSKILNVLKQHNAQATFFLLSSRIPGNESLIKRTLTEGHEIGNHLTIDYPSILFPPHKFEQQLLEADKILSNYSTLRWFRPGSGWFNQTMLATIDKHNYRMALGSVYPFDPQIPSSWFSTHYILHNVKPGSIIILHDRGGRGERTVKTLSVVLPELQRRGYQVVTLSELVNEKALANEKELSYATASNETTIHAKLPTP